MRDSLDAGLVHPLDAPLPSSGVTPPACGTSPRRAARARALCLSGRCHASTSPARMTHGHEHRAAPEHRNLVAGHRAGGVGTGGAPPSRRRARTRQRPGQSPGGRRTCRRPGRGGTRPRCTAPGARTRNEAGAGRPAPRSSGGNGAAGTCRGSRSAARAGEARRAKMVVSRAILSSPMEAPAWVLRTRRTRGGCTETRPVRTHRPRTGGRRKRAVR